MCSAQKELPPELPSEIEKTYVTLQSDATVVVDASVDGSDSTVEDSKVVSGNACNEVDNTACSGGEVCVGDWACGLDDLCPGTCQKCEPALQVAAANADLQLESFEVWRNCGIAGQPDYRLTFAVEADGVTYTVVADLSRDPQNGSVARGYYRSKITRSDTNTEFDAELEIRLLREGFSDNVEIFLPTISTIVDVTLRGTACGWVANVC